MQPIETQFEDKTFTYTQLERHGNLAIYAQTHKVSGGTCYEVVRIGIQRAHTWPTGVTTPEKEAYPSAGQWGRQGFTCFTLDEGRALLAELRAASAHE